MYQQIKAVRKYTGKTQKEFGETLGVSRDVYANIENARVEPSKTFIQLLCSTYNINPEWLATGRGNMFVQDDNVLLSQLAIQYDLDAFSRKFIEAYISLPQSHRDVIKDFALSLVEAANAPAAPEVVIDGSAIDDPEIASELSVIARELEQEKRVVERLSASPSAKDA